MAESSEESKSIANVDDSSPATVVRGDPSRPKRPLFTVPVNRPSDLSHGDHILYLMSNDKYRPMYRSALVESLTDGDVSIITYTPEAVQHLVRPFHSFQSLHRVDYTEGCRDEIVVKRAKERLGECHYHGLFNNSHHFVSWAKTGVEYSLTDLVLGIEEPWKSDYELEPILTKSLTERIEDIKPADHIMENSGHHWLVESVDTIKSTFRGFTCNHKRVTLKEVVWKSKRFHRIEYPQDSAAVVPESVDSEVLKRAQIELNEKSEWEESDEFVTMMKFGKPKVISEHCVMKSDCEPVSCTLIGPHVTVNAGDHLLIKMEGGNYRSILVEVIVNADTIVCTPHPNGDETHGYFVVSETEAYRVNYPQHLPVNDILMRAESNDGEHMLKSCKHDPSLFVSWAITGRQFSVSAEELIKKQVLKLVRPINYKRISPEMSDEIQLGDHLFIDRPTYRWHLLLAERCDEPNMFKVIYYSNGSVKETVEKIDPSKVKVYKLIYVEEFAPEVAIKRARSRVGEIKVDLWARMDFVRWAKTGSNEGVEVDFMTNLSMPSSKSSIMCFKQLSPGDYLIVEKNKTTSYHHCLVLSVELATKCTVVEVWNDKLRQTEVILKPNKRIYYKLNYAINAGVCRPSQASIELARKLLSKSNSTSGFIRQTFINYLKTGDDLKPVEVNSLQDDRTLLRREKVESALQLKRGDHVERPLHNLGGLMGYFHHMLVLQPLDNKHCEVVHCHTGHHGVTGSSIRRETVDIFETKKASRVKYIERIDPDEGIARLLQLAERAPDKESQVEQAADAHYDRDYDLFKNNCEHIVMLGTIGTAVSIQVNFTMYTNLHKQAGKVSPQLGEACFRAAIGTHLFIDTPLFIRGLYKVHRKRKFDVISDAEAKRKATVNSFATANALVGAISGAIVGQAAIPVPGLGAVVGAFIGTLAGRSLGKLEGKSAADRFISHRGTTLPTVVHCTYTPLES